MNKEYNIALIGEIDGCIETTLEVLLKRDFPINNLFPLTVDECETTSVMYSGKPVDVHEIATFDWQQVDIAYFLRVEMLLKNGSQSLKSIVLLLITVVII